MSQENVELIRDMVAESNATGCCADNDAPE
jgi:hypothetical protein